MPQDPDPNAEGFASAILGQKAPPTTSPLAQEAERQKWVDRLASYSSARRDIENYESMAPATLEGVRSDLYADAAYLLERFVMDWSEHVQGDEDIPGTDAVEYIVDFYGRAVQFLELEATVFRGKTIQQFREEYGI